MPIQRSNALIALSGKTAQPGQAIRDAKAADSRLSLSSAREGQLGASEDLLAAQAEAQTQESEQRKLYLNDFAGVVNLANKMGPLVPRQGEDPQPFITALTEHIQKLEIEGTNAVQSRQILAEAQRGNFTEITRRFKGVQSANESLQRKALGLNDESIPADVRTFREFESFGDPNNPDQITPRQERFLTVKRATSQFATVGGEKGTVDLTTDEFTALSTVEEEASAAEIIAGGAEKGKQDAITASLPKRMQVERENLTSTEEVRRAIKTRSQARDALPTATFQINTYSDLIDEVISDPVLASVVGFLEGRKDTGFTAKESAILSKLEQLQGGAFLDAFQSLKGGGPITDTEGQAATKAKTRILVRTVPLDDYKNSLRDLQSSFNNGLKILQDESAVFVSGDVATGKNGEKMIFRDGAWQVR